MHTTATTPTTTIHPTTCPPSSAARVTIHPLARPARATAGTYTLIRLKLYSARGDADITWTGLCDCLDYAWVGLGDVLTEVQDRCRSEGEPDLSTLVAEGRPSSSAVAGPPR